MHFSRQDGLLGQAVFQPRQLHRPYRRIGSAPSQCVSRGQRLDQQHSVGNPPVDVAHQRLLYRCILYSKGNCTVSVPTSVDTRRVVTCATTASASGSAPASAEVGTWQWRKAQLRTIAMFTGPALSIPLADPIMSLVDTVCIGQVTGNFISCMTFEALPVHQVRT